MKWLTDTLARRLFLLMWVALVVSHVAAYMVVQVVLRPPGQVAHAPPRPSLPTFPSLPPTPGLHLEPAPPPQAGAAGPGDPPGAPPALPTDALLLDYGVRLMVIALAAWFGARWVAGPVRKLARASHALADSIGAAAPPREVDEAHGPREVRETAQVFNTMARRLREQFQARGLMMAAISHDLRTPLTRLRMRLENMRADPVLQERCVADVREMNELIDTVLEVFRGADANGGERLQDTDISALVQALTDDLLEQGQAVSFEGASAITLARPAALRRVVGNLISNALRYGERAEVSVTTSQASINIVVQDHGPGIAPAQLESVFQPFFRVESSRNRHTGGVGLGLYIARDLLQRQGARLDLSNPPQGGLRAQVTLPRARGDKGQAPLCATPSPDQAPSY